MLERRRPRGVTHVRGQGQQPRVPGSDGAGTAKRSYLTSEVGGWGSREELPHVRGQGQKPGGPHARRARPRGVTHVRGQGQRPRVPGCDDAGTAERSYPMSEVGGRPRGATQGLRSGAAAERNHPCPHTRYEGRRPGGPTPRPRSPGCEGAGGLEELSHVEGQEGQQ